jgi:uncharacterized protein (DUF983 family)
MGEMHAAHLDFAAAFGAVERCPGCGSAELATAAVAAGADVHCRACGVSWHIDLGRIAPVQPELSPAAIAGPADDAAAGPWVLTGTGPCWVHGLSPGPVTLIEGSAFCVSDAAGAIVAHRYS